MVKKIQILVREVYEQEETEKVWSHIKTGDTISDYDYRHDLPEGDTKEDYTRKETPTGKMELLTTDNDPIYGQVFSEEEFDIRDLILHLNRTR
jgi:hypothetical protein